MLPSLQNLARISKEIKNLPNKQGEYKQKIHYCCYLLCCNSGLRISEAVKFDLNTKTSKGLYRLDKPKGKKERLVYISPEVVKELKKNNWQPNQTNRFNFYHFLRKIKRELNISQNTELTPHTLRRAFATYQAENGLPLPLLQKLLGHASIRTTALYWMNIYEDDDSNDIPTGKFWLTKPKNPLPEPENSVKINLDEMPVLLEPMPFNPPNYLSKISQLESQLSQISNENNSLKSELVREKEQNANLHQEKFQLATEKAQIKQELANEQAKRIVAESNLSQANQNNQHLHQQLQIERETNANLTQKLSSYEQNYSNLINAYQQATKDKEKAQKQLNQLTREIKNAVRLLTQWQKFNYYQQLEKERSKQQAQIIQPNFKPPPWKKS